MRKHGMLLTVIAAVLLVALCVTVLRLSDVLLPDYQDEAEEIALPGNSTMLTVNDREAADLWPWDIYHSGRVYSVDEEEAEYLFSDKRISELVETLSPWVAYDLDQVEWGRHMETADDDGMSIYFLKDIMLPNTFGDSYRVNIAFAEETLIYYCCDRMGDETYHGAEGDLIAYGYERLNRDYEEFVEYSGDYEVGGYYEYDGVMSLMSDANSFALFLQKLTALDYANAAWSGLSVELTDMTFAYTEMFQDVVGDGTNAGMVYRHADDTPDVVNVEFQRGDLRPVIFYDLDMCSVTGFSLESTV